MDQSVRHSKFRDFLTRHVWGNAGHTCGNAGHTCGQARGILIPLTSHFAVRTLSRLRGHRHLRSRSLISIANQLDLSLRFGAVQRSSMHSRVNGVAGRVRSERMPGRRVLCETDRARQHHAAASSNQKRTGAQPPASQSARSNIRRAWPLNARRLGEPGVHLVPNQASPIFPHDESQAGQ